MCRRSSGQLCRQHWQGVPIVALKTGSSSIGQALTVSHTGSLSGEDDLYDALFRRVGVIRVHSPASMLETLKLLCIAGAAPWSECGRVHMFGRRRNLAGRPWREDWAGFSATCLRYRRQSYCTVAADCDGVQSAGLYDADLGAGGQNATGLCCGPGTARRFRGTCPGLSGSGPGRVASNIPCRCRCLRGCLSGRGCASSGMRDIARKHGRQHAAALTRSRYRTPAGHDRGFGCNRGGGVVVRREGATAAE